MTNDQKVFSADLLPRAFVLIRSILSESQSDDKDADPDSDALTHAINTQKGRAIEALISYALRNARIADREAENRRAGIGQVGSILDAELNQCRNANFDVSTLMGAYINNLHYLDPDWLDAAIVRIFPFENYPTNFRFAIEGLPYSQAYRPVFEMMRSKGIINAALSMKVSDTARENIVQRIMVSLLWGAEHLDGPLMRRVYEHSDDVQIAICFFWKSRKEKVDATVANHAIQFWKRTLEWLEGHPQSKHEILSSLGSLAVYLTHLDREKVGWLKLSAPHLEPDHEITEFIGALSQLVDSYPAEVAEVLTILIATNKPSYDFDNQLEATISKLGASGHKVEAISLCNQLLHMKEFEELGKTLMRSPG